ncbi:NAD(P)-binding domain-containing protein [Microbacterium sp. zg.B48]|uniref:NADPH-dependent F420 reductase n=1 Tax=Microbacterium sp. zg.B48 TaxID=2969408 RepID=UPI00214B2D2D|nr:NAD(P)-binding domain-containing protein [Microbacterium sp. zg.B48]MCR2764276.1 NAD(P)-binding domain-containing protein [Microbacterium sp. zg.B48]
MSGAGAATPRPVVGILGFGKLGMVLARSAEHAGHRVLAAASGDPIRLRMMRDALTPGVEIGWAQEVAERADIVILALPFSAYRELPATAVAGKVVVDATNHWPEVDGPRELYATAADSTSEVLQRELPASIIVKAFNHIGYHDLEPPRWPVGDPRRTAIAIAGDDRQATAAVAVLVQAMGFAPLEVGRLAGGRVLEPGSRAFGASLPERDLRRLLAMPPGPAG